MGERTRLQHQPVASVVIPMHDDEEWIGRALESCLGQSLERIEIICVDDASTDRTCEVVERFASHDARVRLLRQEANQSAFQARRVGIMHATAPYVMFLDGDDELAVDAAYLAVQTAQAHRADIVGFGVEIIADGGDVPRRFETALQPRHTELVGEDILPALFPEGEVAQGHLWRYLWSVELLRAAYAALPRGLQLHRANDIPITMLATANARKYVSTSERLYRYFFRRGVSGQRVASVEGFRFYLTGLDSIDVIASGIHEIADGLADSAGVVRAYESARLSAIQVILRYAVTVENDSDQAECLSLLAEQAGPADVVRAAATFYPEALPVLKRHRHTLGMPAAREPRTVMLFTGNLGNGGVQGVLVSQAQHLVDAGYRVVVALRTLRGRVHELPEGVDLVEVSGDSLGEKLGSFRAICHEYSVDRVIDHYILYNDDWPYFALMAETHGVTTIGWIHNFALRPMFDFNHRTAYLTRYLPLLEKVVTLSATDVAFWQSQGIEHAVYLPNPPSPWLLERPLRSAPRNLSDGPVRLVWWGRIQQRTKRVRELIDVAAGLRQLGVDFRLTVIGPDSDDLTAGDLREEAVAKAVDDAVVLAGPLYGEELLNELQQSDLYVCTSAIEGYPLTLIEAQTLGLPVAMYELPWLAVAEGNEGLITAEQEDSWGLAHKIAALRRDPAAYSLRSQASLDAATEALGHDFTALYSQLLAGTLPEEFSPAPTPEMADLLLGRAVDFHEQNVSRQGRYERRLRGEARAADRARRRDVERLQATVTRYRRDSRRLKTTVLDARSRLRSTRTENRRLKEQMDTLQGQLLDEKKRTRDLRAWWEARPRLRLVMPSRGGDHCA